MEKTMVGCQGLVLVCALFVLTFVGETSAVTCSKLLGPSGLVECVNLYPKYRNINQWTTCLTNSYIRLKSNGQHGCADATATYCLYQCMIESHNINPGILVPAPVYDDCACGSDALRTRQLPNSTSTIPPWCLSPSGQECSWYKQCLEEQHPCQGTSAAYAIKYAEKFCNLYTDHASKFSQEGQTWINAVRKCLQVALVPILRPWVTITCEEIRQMAFSSHSGCYVSPYPGAPSICDLPDKDWLNSFWTIKEALLSDSLASLKGFLTVFAGCTGKKLNGIDLKKMIKVKFTAIVELFKRQKRSTLEELDDLAGAVVDAIASKLGWRDSGVMWYAYSNYSSLTNIVPVEVLIAGKGTYDLDSVMVADFNLTAVTEKVVKAVQDGDLFFRNTGDKFGPIYVKQMEECVDFECQQVTRVVTAPPNKYTSSAFDLANNIMHPVSFLFFSVYIINVL